MAIDCKHVDIGPGCQIAPSAQISCDYFHLGPRSVIGDGCQITGRKIHIGTECWLGDHIVIGGGSCHDAYSELHIGDLCHLGDHAFINTARKVTIGDEVGIGMHSRLFTHGAYLSELDGFPVKFAPISIGSRVWIPNATVLPGVSIGDDCVVAVGSVVNHPLPSGCLAGGVPAKVIQEDAYPKKLSSAEKKSKLGALMEEFQAISIDHGFDFDLQEIENGFAVNDVCVCIEGAPKTVAQTTFCMDEKKVKGRASPFSELLKNELRRHGIRFRSFNLDGKYESW